MDIVEAINQRKSIRAFKPDPVPREILNEIVELSVRAPSWGNTQPWEFAIVGGEKLEEIRQDFVGKEEEPPVPDIARPEGFPEPYDARRRALAAMLFEAGGIGREDKEERARWRLQGLRHFGSSSVIYFCIERSFYFQGDSLNVWPIFDCGLVDENIMLLATKYGLGTIAQAQAVLYPDVLRKVLGVPDSKLIVLGISIGYPNWDDPTNQFRSERESLNRVATWHGFD